MNSIVTSASGTLAPVSTVAAASASAPVPRFRDATAAQPLINLPMTVTARPLTGCGQSGAELSSLAAGGNVNWTVGVNCDTSTGCPGENDVDVVATGGQTISSCTVTPARADTTCVQSGSTAYVLVCPTMNAGDTCSAVVATQPSASSNPSLNGAPRSPTQPFNPNGGGTTNAPVSTVTTNPPGLQVAVDTVTAAGPATYDWNIAEFHTIDAESQASPDGGTNYAFDSWSDGGAQSHTVQATYWATYTANFTATQYLLTTNVSGSGSITCAPTSLCTPGSASGTFWVNANQSVTLTATPGAGYQFANWTEDGSAAGTSTALAVLMGGPHSVTASFTGVVQYTLTTQVSPSGAGVVNLSPSGGTYASGTKVCLTAAANSGWQFSFWIGETLDSSGCLTMDGNKSMTANFTAVQPLSFYPVTPCRVADTRGNGKTGAFGPPSISGGTSRDFPIPASGCGVPSTAPAYSLNVTVVPPGQLTYLTMWPTGQTQPTVSTLNDFSTQVATPGNVVANAAIVPAGAGGSVSVYVSDTSDVVIDINGYFAPPGTGGLAFYPLAPCRVADTRGNGKSGSFGPPTMAGRYPAGVSRFRRAAATCPPRRRRTR